MDLLFFIYAQNYQNINDEEIKIKLIKDNFKNKLFIKKSYVFLSDMIEKLKPEVYIEGTEQNEEALINSFLNLNDNKSLSKFKNLIDFLNSLQSIELNESLLYFFEIQCQFYFSNILNLYYNQYSEKACENLLLKTSLSYLKKSLQYLYENKDINNNNILKIYAIAYIKTYFYYYVEINFNHNDKCNFNNINQLLIIKNKHYKLLIKMRNIYIFRLYCKRFENFDQFKNFDFKQKNIPIYEDLLKKLNEEENEKKNYIFKNSFNNPNKFEIYKKFIKLIDFLNDEDDKIKKNCIKINENFDIFYCCLVNKMISYLYGNNKKLIIEKMKKLSNLILNEINLDKDGIILFNYLLDYNSFKEKAFKKISDVDLKQDEFEILLYVFRLILNIKINKEKCFYNNILEKNTSKFINENYIPGSFPFINEYIKSYNILNSFYPIKGQTGYYICKDCGYLYEVPPCSFPTSESYCPNKHKIGGKNHILCKKDIRIFNSKQHYEELCRHTWIDRYILNSFSPLIIYFP